MYVMIRESQERTRSIIVLKKVREKLNSSLTKKEKIELIKEIVKVHRG